MKAYAIGDCNSGGDEWDQELKLMQQAVEAVNKLNPKPKFFVICGDLVHGMPGKSAVTVMRTDQHMLASSAPSGAAARTGPGAEDVWAVRIS
ncbi:UNVERIFIED_CONTAM: hypothetical protein K2H54_016718 [Gekko kuhli]